MPKDSVKNNIKQALVNLLETKAYSEISVTELINAAGVARVSFYRHYHTIDEVVDDIAEDMTSFFVKEVYPIICENDEKAWRDFLHSHFHRFPDHHRTLSSKKFENGHVLFAHVNSRLQKIEKDLPSGSMHDKYAVFGKIELVNNIIKKWMDEGMKESPDEMIDYIMSFILKF